jgi:hypothetical protein
MGVKKMGFEKKKEERGEIMFLGPGPHPPHKFIFMIAGEKLNRRGDRLTCMSDLSMLA